MTLRSLPRRYRSALRPIDDELVDDWAQQVGPGGMSALDHLVQAARGITVLHEALKKVLVASEPPVLMPAVLDEAARTWDPAHDVEAELDLLADEAEAMAVTITGTDGRAWTRTATVAGADREVTALDVVNEAVRTGVTHLKAAQAAFEAARRP